MIGSEYDTKSRMSSGKKRRATKRPDDWKQQRRKLRRVRQQEKDKRYGNARYDIREVSRRS